MPDESPAYRTKASIMRVRALVVPTHPAKGAVWMGHAGFLAMRANGRMRGPPAYMFSLGAASQEMRSNSVASSPYARMRIEG